MARPPNIDRREGALISVYETSAPNDDRRPGVAADLALAEDAAASVCARAALIGTRDGTLSRHRNLIPTVRVP